MSELRRYLEILLDHRCNQGNETCAECQSLQRIYAYMQTEIFSSVVYEETPLAPRPAGSVSKPMNRAIAQ